MTNDQWFSINCPCHIAIMDSFSEPYCSQKLRGNTAHFHRSCEYPREDSSLELLATLFSSFHELLPYRYLCFLPVNLLVNNTMSRFPTSKPAVSSHESIFCHFFRQLISFIHQNSATNRYIHRHNLIIASFGRT